MTYTNEVVKSIRCDRIVRSCCCYVCQGRQLLGSAFRYELMLQLNEAAHDPTAGSLFFRFNCIDVKYIEILSRARDADGNRAGCQKVHCPVLSDVASVISRGQLRGHA